MSSKELELCELSSMCLSCTVHTKSDHNIFSSELNFNGGGWKLNYWKDGTDYSLNLYRCSGVPPPPFHASVFVESSVDGRIASVLPQEEHFPKDEFQDNRVWYTIWKKEDDEILRSVPEFRLHGVLKLIVVLKLEEKDSVATHTECSIPEGLELPCVESLTEDLQRMMVQDSDGDVEFRCADKSFKAHDAVVCARSPVIRTMLGTDMVEGRTRIVDIPDMTPEVFQVFLGYLYTGKLPELTFEVAMSLYESGDQYEVLGLARRCRKYLVQHLTVQNACDVLAVADAHSDEGFVEKVVAYMLETKVPQTSDRWSAFSDDHPKLANKVLKRGWDAWAPT